MLALLKYIWSVLTSDAPKDESGCGRGGLCRHQADCPRLNCPGHPRNNIIREFDEGTPCTWSTCWGLYLFIVGGVIAWIAVAGWLIWKAVR